jgi:hypothetical protein
VLSAPRSKVLRKGASNQHIQTAPKLSGSRLTLHRHIRSGIAITLSSRPFPRLALKSEEGSSGIQERGTEVPLHEGYDRAGQLGAVLRTYGMRRGVIL